MGSPFAHDFAKGLASFWSMKRASAERLKVSDKSEADRN